jgi:hypothetical protein
MKTLYLSLALCLAGCAEKIPLNQIDSNIKPYIDMWHQDAINTLGHDIPIEFIQIMLTSDLQALGEDGHCYPDIGNYNVIHLDVAWWQTAGDSQRQLVVYHELGHCVLGRVHNNNLIMAEIHTPNGIIFEPEPVSIMYYEAIIPDDYWEQHKTQLLIEYFSGER